MESFEKTFDEWCNVNRRLYKESKEYIINALRKLPNNRIGICDEYPVCVPYDGGRHPEYDSNCFSDVCEVYLRDDNVYLEIEETDEYNIDNINAESLCEVAFAVKGSIETDYDIEDE